ncbi:class II aldolase/adducin domain-containing protein [Dichomitus squalens]|uniref:Class II aldolase/adducin domain-containing protein n=1 Tax=Dichomitus squalens TaxID=114155 RepID=A0A4Q9N6P5_9APHY|nr:class II aldolase/adducin domain-containing protein [Dichomitus squalens]
MAPVATEAYSDTLKAAALSVAVGKPLQPPQFTSKEQERAWLKFRLAQAFRLFGKFGYDEGVAGHITVRDTIRTDCFWVNPFGKHFSLIQPEDLILVDHHGVVQAAESGPNTLLNKAAFMIHSAIHTARPDVHCAAHSHSVYGRAFSTLGKPLDMITQDSCAFYEDHAVYTQYGGVVLDEEEGQHIVKALGNKKAVILQNHGLLVATNSIEATLHFFVALEKSCQVQLLADAAAAGTGSQTKKVSEAECKLTYNVVGTHTAGWFSGLPHFQVLEAQEGVSFDFGATQ